MAYTMPWPEVKLTARLPETANAVAPPCAACSPSHSTAIFGAPKTLSSPVANDAW